MNLILERIGMVQTIAGGIKAAESNKRKYGEDYYRKIGHLGGVAKTDKPKGFAYMKATGQDEKIRDAGRKGGRIGKRGANNPQD